MGVGDRHSKRVVAADKAKAPAPIQRAWVIDDRELDDEFSAWDEDDAGALKPAHLRPETRATVAQTRIERRGGTGVTSAAKRALPPPVIADGSSRRATPLSDALLDPVAMRDIVIARARTLDDPMTTRVLAEIARAEAKSDRPSQRAQRVSATDDAAVIAPSRVATRSADMIAASRTSSRSTRDEIAVSRRRTARRSIAREEPFRKK